MTVWAVIEGFHYDSHDVVALYDNKPEADKHAEEIRARQRISAEYTDVEEWEVFSSLSQYKGNN